MFSTCPGIIPSLDVDIDEAVKLSSEISELEREISGLKIGSVLAWNHGLPKVVKELRKVNNCPIIFDAQKAGTDIPEIVKEQVKVVANANIDAFIASPLGAGSSTLEAFIDSCFKYNIVPIVVLEMTHPNFDAFLAKNAPEAVLKQSLEQDVACFVAPANKPERLKVYKEIAKTKQRDIKIFSPGIGPQGGGPDSAVKAGADFVIVGRSIYKAENPKEEVTRIYNLIK